MEDVKTKTSFQAGVHGCQEAVGQLFKALSVAQAKAGNAAKDAVNPHLRNSYASLASVLDTIRPVLEETGLSLYQAVDDDQLVNVLGHSSGAMVVSFVPLINAKKDMQALGSAITYARRYSVSAIFSVSQEDDDGNQAAGKQNSPGGAPAYKPPAASAPAAPAAKAPVSGGFGKITDAKAQAVLDARTKVGAVMSVNDLNNIANFAAAKYAGEALAAVNGFIAERQAELEQPA